MGPAVGAAQPVHSTAITAPFPQSTPLCANKRKCGKPKKPNERRKTLEEEKQTDSTQQGLKWWVQCDTKPNAT